MLTLIRKRFTYTNIALTLALVFAMTGGAYAANKYLITSTKQISPKVLKSLVGKSGKNGTNGATGPAGPQGPAGPAGTAGKEGPAGKEGSAGTPGTPGKEGTSGKEGKEGSPWVAGGTLPSEETETGVWGEPLTTTEGHKNFAISFTLPLAKAPEPIYVALNEESKPGCPGRGPEGHLPSAEPGKLCVYAMVELKVSATNFFSHWIHSGGEWTVEEGDSPVGAIVHSFCEGYCELAGTWAVTAE